MMIITVTLENKFAPLCRGDRNTVLSFLRHAIEVEQESITTTVQFMTPSMLENYARRHRLYEFTKFCRANILKHTIPSGGMEEFNASSGTPSSRWHIDCREYDTVNLVQE